MYPEQHDAAVSLSDTEFADEFDKLQEKRHQAGYLPMMQNTARALEAIALLTIDREGQVIRYELTWSSGNRSFGASVHRAVQASSPLPPLPETYPGEILEAEIYFTAPASS